MTDIATLEQPTPRGTGRDIANIVCADIQARVEKGRQQYGERLKAHNGRNALVDLYQELLDAVLYLAQFIEENDNASQN